MSCRGRLHRLLLRVDAVAIDHHAEKLGMPRFLHALQGDGIAKHRIVDGGVKAATMAPARRSVCNTSCQNGTARSRASAAASSSGQGRVRRVVVIVSLQELPAEQLLVRFRADRHRGAPPRSAA